MLARGSRLRLPAEFRQATRQGRRGGTRTQVHYLAVSDDGGTRIGFIVAKSVGNAVIRNRVKRRLRDIARHHLDRIPTGSLLVVRANPPAAEADHGRLERDFLRSLERVAP